MNTQSIDISLYQKVLLVEKDIHTFENQTDEVVEFIVFRYLPSYKNQRELIQNDKEMIKK